MGRGLSWTLSKIGSNVDIVLEAVVETGKVGLSQTWREQAFWARASWCVDE